MPWRERVRAAWSRLATGGPPDELTLLPKQASLRRYVRVRRGDESWIMMLLPDRSQIEEIGGGGGAAPFLDVQRFLAARGLPVPRIDGHDTEAGVVLLEDLGPRTLGDALAGPDDPAGWHRVEVAYERAVDLLVALRRATAGAGDVEGPWQARAFDVETLAGEWDHFREYLLGEELGRPDLADDPRVIAAGAWLVDRIAAWPRVFVHRDFQSRNLMLAPGRDADHRLVVIDFQDALMGPDVYDLVALLRDSYVQLPDPLVDTLVARFADGTLDEAGPQGATALRRRFDLVTLHRKAKDAGRFVYIDRVKGNPDFLRHIPASLRYVLGALDRLTSGSDPADRNAQEHLMALQDVLAAPLAARAGAARR